MRLLIVENSQLVCDRLLAIFSEMADLRMEVAKGVRQAVLSFRVTKPEVVIMDVQLPDGSGLDLLEVIKQEQPATRVLMYSNHALYRKRCVAEGADYFFDKSMDIERLATTVRDLAMVKE